MSTLTAYISRANLRHNIRIIRQLVGDTQVCPVIKGNAYGHGSTLVASALADIVDAFAVVAIEEAEAVYSSALGKDIIVLRAIYAGISPTLLELAQSRGFHCTLSSLAGLDYIEKNLNRAKSPLKVHLKLDSGMGRGGCLVAQANKLLTAIKQSDAVQLTGVYTHFATADEQDLTYAREQYESFADFINANRLHGDPSIVCHACNSPATFRLPQAYCDMVRPGLAVYGYMNNDHNVRYDLRPVLRIEAPLIQIKKLRAGQSCGYGRMFVLPRDMTIGLVPVGYADALPRQMSNRGFVRIGDVFAPILGRISMDQITIDITDVPNPYEGMNVTVIDDRPDSRCNVKAIADHCKTVCQEILTGIGNRVERVLVEDLPEQQRIVKEQLGTVTSEEKRKWSAKST
ncbi:MAG: alanine racemase [Sedimentisphaerales bacterium]|nr:alanine racemase [Sedimentisphaerales bacterium]